MMIDLNTVDAMIYTPDRWVIVDWGNPGLAIISGWGGSYLYGASWRRSSVITHVQREDDNTFVVKTGSSVYVLRLEGIGYTSMSAGIAEKIKSTGVVVLEDRESIENILNGKIKND